MRRIVRLLLSLVLLAALCPLPQLWAQTTYLTIGTGGVTGVYYPTGSAIAQIINRGVNKHNLRVTVESTRGSVFNVNAIVNGELELGIVQSDRQYQAFNGMADWQGRPAHQLRALFSLHPESVTLVANASRKIATVADLRGKRVNIGNPGSGQRGNAVDLLNAAGIDPQRDIVALEERAQASARMLQDGEIDAYFYTVGHPNGSIREAASGATKVNFVEIPASIVNRLTADYSYYAASVIPVALYPGVVNPQDVPSFGVKGTLCTSAALPDEVAYQVTRAVFENLDDFKLMHPAFSSLSKENMLTGLSAPLHPGALRYFREVGLR